MNKRRLQIVVLIFLLASSPFQAAQAGLNNDGHTLLLLHFDNDLAGADGESPVQAAGVTFESGVLGSGVLVDSADILDYSSAANFTPAAGTIEFWVKPRWSGADGNARMFFGLGAQPYTMNDLIIQKDGADNLVFIMEAPDSEAYQAYSLRDWQADDWHHIAVTWTIPGEMKTYVDGVRRIAHPASSSDLIGAVPAALSVGQIGGTQQSNAVIDELRISDIARSQSEITASYLAGITAVSSLTIQPITSEMFLTWRQTPGLSAETNIGTRAIPPSAATWLSSNPAVATIDASGRITALAPGTARITATFMGAQAALDTHSTGPMRQPEFGPIDPALAAPAPNSLYVLPVVIIRYLPTPDGTNLDVSFDPDFYELHPITLSDMEQRINTFDKYVKFMLEEGGTFRGYKDSTARPSIGYKVVDYITVYEPTPPGNIIGMSGGFPVYMPDFQQIFDRFHMENYVNNLGVKQFWFWSGGVVPSFPSYDPAIHKPDHFRAMPESNMSSPITGDISNSSRDNSDLPIYNHTYVVYSPSFRRTQAEAVHTRGHQLEATLSYINQQQDGNTALFWQKFVGRDENFNFVPGRCGDTHHPPNAAHDYDYQNMTPVASDIEDWTPEGIGQKKQVNALTWGNIPYPWPNGPLEQKTESQWYMYWMQNMPGRGNTIPYGQNRMTNWWTFTADWDASVSAGLGLYEPASCDYAISASDRSFGAGGGTGTVHISAGSGCRWIASSNANWMMLDPGSRGGGGNGTVSYTVAANTSNSSRIGTLVVAGQTITVTQERRWQAWLPAILK